MKNTIIIRLVIIAVLLIVSVMLYMSIILAPEKPYTVIERHFDNENKTYTYDCTDANGNEVTYTSVEYYNKYEMIH